MHSQPYHPQDLARSILVIGCGNIGSRILQSIAHIPEKDAGPLNIFGLEPSEKARQLAKFRFEDVNHQNLALTLTNNIKTVPQDIELLVVAVDAKNRLAALRTALSHCRVKYVLLEKTLFVRDDEFSIAADLLKNHQVKAWVNCFRNVWPGYKWLKSKIENNSIKSIHIKGGDWNLASNAIHFLAVIEYISGLKISDLKMEENNIITRPAKRAQYKEISGHLIGKLQDKDAIRLSSLSGSQDSIEILIHVGDNYYKIYENRQQAEILDAAGRVIETHRFPMLHASELENALLEIINDGSSVLPSYEESTALHLKLFSALDPFLSETVDGTKYLPIT